MTFPARAGGVPAGIEVYGDPGPCAGIELFSPVMRFETRILSPFVAA
jgi:hypothetical protein